ncbi:MAG: alpha/beta fold hydrolase [Gammaproteobacteria bacterium]
MPYCEVEKGVRLYYETFGHGQPIVFVHGGAMSHEFWEQQVYALADSFRVVAYDLRGHGESDKPAHGHTFDRFVQDLEALIEHLRLDAVSLVCHAVGGYVGILYALRNPERLARLVLVSSSARFLGADEERGGFSNEFWDDYRRGLARDKIGASAQLIERVFYYKDPGPETRQAVLNIMLQWPLYALRLLGRDAERINFEDQLPRINTPTLVIHGRHDRKQRFSGARFLCDKLPNARLMIFEESAHLPPLEEVERFNRAVTDFMQQETPTRQDATAPARKLVT